MKPHEQQQQQQQQEEEEEGGNYGEREGVGQEHLHLRESEMT